MRDLTTRERQILEIMLRQLPVAEPELRQQLATAKVVPIDDEGSLRLHAASPLSVRPVERVPVTAIFEDADKIPIYLLLHVIEGRLAELEIYKADGSEIVIPPTPENLHF